MGWFSTVISFLGGAMTMGWFSTLIGFSGGAVAAAGLKALFDWLRRPILRAQLVRNLGCYVEASRNTPPTHTAKYLRLQIANAGRSTLKGCAGYITRLTIKRTGQTTINEQEVLELIWSHYGAGHRDIPHGAFFYMDVATLDRFPSQPSALSLVDKLPFHLQGLLKGAGEFELEILIAADNAEPLRRSVAFEFDPQKQDLTFRYDS